MQCNICQRYSKDTSIPRGARFQKQVRSYSRLRTCSLFKFIGGFSTTLTNSWRSASSRQPRIFLLTASDQKGILFRSSLFPFTTTERYEIRSLSLKTIGGVVLLVLTVKAACEIIQLILLDGKPPYKKELVLSAVCSCLQWS